MIFNIGHNIGLIRHMKENNKSKFAMNIFHQARKQIALIAGLLGQSADTG
jgi:hypothetical protein